MAISKLCRKYVELKKNISKIFTHLKVELIGHVVENHTIGEYHYHIGNDYDGLSYGLSL